MKKLPKELVESLNGVSPEEAAAREKERRQLEEDEEYIARQRAEQMARSAQKVPKQGRSGKGKQ